MELTNRELWLMEVAFMEGCCASEGIKITFGPQQLFANWLDTDAADGVTVKDVLIKDAPTVRADQNSK